MMGSLTQLKLIKTLNALDIDLSIFEDVTFDSICDDPETQQLMDWICDSFDGDNSLSEEEISDYEFLKIRLLPEVLQAPETFKIESDDYLKETVGLLNHRLSIARSNEDHCMSQEALLQQKEKKATCLLNGTEAHFLDFATYKLVNTTNMIEQTLWTCLRCNILLPNFQLWHGAIERQTQALIEFTSAFITSVECFLEKVNEDLAPVPENCDEIGLYLEIYLEMLVHYRCLRSPSTSECILDGETEKDAKRKINNYLRKKEVVHLKRQLGIYEYLMNKLNLRKDLIMQCLAQRSLEKLCHDDASRRLSDRSSQILNFIEDVTEKTKDAGTNNEQVKSRIAEDRKLSKLKINLSSAGVLLANDPGSPSTLCKEFLYTSSDHDLLFSQTFRSRINSLLWKLRSGPTLKLCLVPAEVMYLLHDCRRSREKAEKEFKEIVSRFSKFSAALTKPENTSWVNFLGGRSNHGAIQSQLSTTMCYPRNFSILDMTMGS